MGIFKSMSNTGNAKENSGERTQGGGELGEGGREGGCVVSEDLHAPILTFLIFCLR